MEFLKNLFNGDEALTFDQLSAKIAEAKLNVVNIADGSYVAKGKYDSKVNSLTQQVADLQAQVSQRDTDLSDLSARLTAAQTDAGKLAEAQNALSGLQSKYDADKQAYEKRISKQAYEFAVREKAGALKFSSSAAKKAFIAEAIAKEFKQDGDKLQGYDDFVSDYQKNDPGAFVTEPAPDPTPAPTIVLPTGGPAPGKKKSLMDIMRAKNENPNMVVDFGNE